MKIVAVVQARYASTRLPGKVLLPLQDYPAIQWVVRAAEYAAGMDDVIVATSTNIENGVIANWCHERKIKCFRGSEDDVLDRYRGVIEKTKADAIVRLTADCPMLDSRVIGEVIALYKANKVAYATNTDPATWPDGLDVEVISAKALLTAASEATRQSDRDTVTRFIARNRSRFPAINLTCPLNLSNERWVLDSPEDLQFLREMLKLLPDSWTPNYLEFLDVLNEYPELRKINAKYIRNERFFEGMATEPVYERDYTRSKLALERAERTIPFGAQTFSKSRFQFPPEESPLFLSHGDGAYAFDVDGNDYVDLVGALLPNVLGYRDPDVDYAIRRQLDSGISLSLATELEADLAERLCAHIPCAESVKFGKSGSDVTTAAVKAARAYTGCDQIITQGYHGWHDWSMESSERKDGIPRYVLDSNIKVAINDIDAIKKAIWSETAAVIIEPEGWTAAILNELKNLCQKEGVVLIFDEIITGFRWSIGGYQKHIGVTPDMACFGKAMANGMPMSAVVGRKDIMAKFCPPDNAFYSGTFFGETLSIAASIATIDKMERESVIPRLWNTGSAILHGARTRIAAADLQDVVQLYGDEPLIRIRCNGRGATTPEQVKTVFIKTMAANGVLVIASHNVCYALRETEVNRILKAYDAALTAIKELLDGKTIYQVVMAGSSVR